MEITLEEIQRKFENLPENVKWAIMAANVDEHLVDIGQKAGLKIEQMGQLSLETHMVIFGFTHPDKFKESLKESLGLPEEKIKSIVNDVNEKILKKIRVEMMAEHGEPKETLEKERITPQINKEETKVLDRAGIKIITPNLNAFELQASNARPMKIQGDETQTLEKAGIKIIDSGEKKDGILAQKLGSSFKTPVTETKHSMDNISKTNTSAYPAKADPYRLPPE